MEIPAQHDTCIWCGRPFAIGGFRIRPSHVVRSKEHIFPDNIYGRLKTEDVCVQCNNRLGGEVDARLLNDGHIFTAGLAAGLKPEQLLPHFRVYGTTPQGESFEYRVSDGKWRLQPSFSVTGFKIGAVEGCASQTDLQNAKRKMLKLVLADKSNGLSESQSRQWVEDLFEDFFHKQAQCSVYCDRIKQGLVAHPFNAKGAIRITTQPWETQWCIAKIAYEVAHVLLPPKLRRKILTALSQLREYVEARKERHGIFRHITLKAQAVPRHEVEISVKGRKMRFAIRLFGREQWTLGFDVFKADQPARLDSYHLLVVNDCWPTGAPTVRVYENEQPSN